MLGRVLSVLFFFTCGFSAASSEFLTDEIGMRAFNVSVSLTKESFDLFGLKAKKCLVIFKPKREGHLVAHLPLTLDCDYIQRFLKIEQDESVTDRVNPTKMDMLNQKIVLTPDANEGKGILFFNHVILGRKLDLVAYLFFQFENDHLLIEQIQTRHAFYSEQTQFLDDVYSQFGLVLIPETYLLSVESNDDNLDLHLAHNSEKSIIWGAKDDVFANCFRIDL